MYIAVLAVLINQRVIFTIRILHSEKFHKINAMIK